MSSRKRMLVMLSIVMLLVFSFVPAVTASQVTANVIFNGKQIPVNIVPEGTGEQFSYKLEIPLQDAAGNKKITILYTINLKTLSQGSLLPKVPSTGYEQIVPVPEIGTAKPQRTIPGLKPPVTRPPVSDPKPPAVPRPVPEPEIPAAQPPVSDPEPPVAPPPPVPETEPSASSQFLTSEELQMFDLLNEERVKMGLNELKIHEGLVKLARLKSKDMIDRGYFAHQSPTYGSPFDMMRDGGISFSYAGENLAGASAVSRAHASLMNSPGHRANILNADYTHVGIGIVDGGPYGKMFTQLFIGI